ncbi:MAG: tetratricopeptide repeat protein [Pirellulales bacterium]|nr:tetratricopeptide repeat protein [Pirellulales bacterium]
MNIAQEAPCRLTTALSKNTLDQAPLFVRAGKSAIRPEVAEAIRLGTELRAAGRTQFSVAVLEQALAHGADCAELWFAYGCSLQRAERWPAATNAFARAHQLSPDWAEPLVNWGNLCEKRGDLVQARLRLQDAVSVDPGHAIAQYNLGNIERQLGEVGTAINRYQRALEIQPDFAAAHWNLATCYLLTGDFIRGWPEYVWREAAGEVVQDNYAFPRLARLSQAAGRTIVVVAEQGLGDEIFFAGNLREFARHAGRVILVCEPRLQELFADSFANVRVIGYERRQDRAPCPVETLLDTRVDYWLPAGDLPGLLQSAEIIPPRENAYLALPSELSAVWRQRLGQLGSGVKVGISWRAGGHPRERARRSTQLRDWLPLLKTPGAQWINLQYGETSREINDFSRDTGIVIHDFPAADPLTRFTDFAALVAGLDLVVAVGNTTVHLAGALGIPAWVVLPTVPSWRWQLRGDSLPWYPSVRAWRQSPGESWLGLFARLSLVFPHWNSQPTFSAATSQPGPEPPLDNVSLPFSSSQLDIQETKLMNHHTRQFRTPTGSFDFAAALSQARQLFAERDLLAAERLTDEILVHAPRQSAAWSLLAHIAKQTERWDLALRSLQRARELSNDDYAIHQDLAETALACGNTALALATFQTTITRWPERVEGWLGCALAQRGAGDFNAAWETLEHAREIAPRNPKVFNFLGGVAIDLRQPERAIAAFQQAVALAPDYAAAWNNLGCVWQAQHDYGQAIACFEQVMRLDANHQSVAQNLEQLRAQVACARSQVSPASFGTGSPVSEISSSVGSVTVPDGAQTPSDHGLPSSLASITEELPWLQAEQSTDATFRFPQTEIHSPAARGLLERAATLFNAEDFATAAELAERILAIQPRHAIALRILGVGQRKRGDLPAAIHSLRQACIADPQNFAMPFELGVCYLERHEQKLAYECFLRVLALKPDFQASYVNLSGIMEQQERYADATHWAQKAVAVLPNCVLARYNLGNSYREQGSLEEAIREYQHALTIDPNYVRAKWNLGICNLHLGNYGPGWEGYEARGPVGEVEFDHYPQPRWQGEDLTGKTILVHAEQGLGDEIVFCSCLPDLLERAGRVVIVCEPRLEKLFRRSFPQAIVYGYLRRKDRLPCQVKEEIHYQLPMGSLPLHFRPTLSAFPRRQRFLTPDPALVNAWRQKFASLGPGLKIGISWRAGGKPLERRKRSIPLDLWGGILQTPGIKFINLQYGDASEDRQEVQDLFGVTLHDWEQGDPLIDVDSFAAKIAALDLVISVGNATVHLAGAVGTPAWTLLPMIPSWRWMIRGDESPWYKTVRLFRQVQRNQWPGVLAAMRRMLAGVLAAPAVAQADLLKTIPCPPIERINEPSLPPLAQHVWLDHTQFSAAATIESFPQILEQAKQAYERTDYTEAERLLRQILTIAPKFPSALHCLGLVAIKQERYDLAIRCLQRALATAEMVPQRRCDLAVAYAGAGRTDEAIACYRRALELLPGYERATVELAKLEKQLLSPPPASDHNVLISLREMTNENVLTPPREINNENTNISPREMTNDKSSIPPHGSNSSNPINPIPALDARNALSQSGVKVPFSPATQDTAATQNTPANQQTLLQQAQELISRCQFDPARGILEQLLRAKAENLQARSLLAEICCQDQDWATAKIQLEKICIAQPTSAAYVRLGTICEKLTNFAEAKRAYQAALSHDADCYEAVVRLGTIYAQAGEASQAEECYRRALRIRPDQRELHHSLGMMLAQQGALDDAIACYERALDCSGARAYPLAQASLAFARLYQGNYQAGWRAYEWRWQCPDSATQCRDVGIPEWRGESLAGKRILIHAEQGLGDEVMFATCYPDVLRQAAEVSILCDPRLLACWKRAFPRARIIPCPRGTEANWRSPAELRLDFQIAAGSLPGILRNRIQDFPAQTQLLSPDPRRLGEWQARLSQLGPGPKIGLSWLAGAKPLDRQIRGLPLAQWESLLATPRAHWVNLQHGAVEGEIHDLLNQTGITVHDWPGSDLKNDLEETLARIAACDAVIAVGNATVHLAGALGVRTWCLLPAFQGWRWGPTGHNTPWYGSVRVMRGTRTGEWQDVLERVAGELAAMTIPARRQTVAAPHFLRQGEAEHTSHIPREQHKLG